VLARDKRDRRKCCITPRGIVRMWPLTSLPAMGESLGPKVMEMMGGEMGTVGTGCVCVVILLCVIQCVEGGWRAKKNKNGIQAITLPLHCIASQNHTTPQHCKEAEQQRPLPRCGPDWPRSAPRCPRSPPATPARLSTHWW
jgi:hypothetical protein